MEVVNQLAAELEVELALESRGPLADGVTLFAEISVVVESDLNDPPPLPSAATAATVESTGSCLPDIGADHHR